MDGIDELRDRGDLFLRVLGEQDAAKEMALMAKENTGNGKEPPTGRPAKDEQMKALKTAHGTPTRQAELPPYVGKDAMPGEED